MTSAPRIKNWGKIIPVRPGGAERSMENPLVALEELQHSPSSQAGLSWSDEEQFRFLGCHLIARAGRLLRMPQSAIATGQVLLHQFYMGQSLLDHAILDVAMAALFVAGKVEESYRRTRDVVNVFHRLHQSLRGLPLRPMSYISDEYYEWRNRLTAAEMLLLAQLGFHVQPVHPMVLLVNYLEALGSSGVFDGAFRQAALNQLNDGMRGVACLRWGPPVLACAAIQRVADERAIGMPRDPEWFRVFDVQPRELELCVRLMGRVYQVRVDRDLPLVPEELAVYAKVFKAALGLGDDKDGGRQGSRSRSRSRSRTRRYHHRSGSREHHRSRSPDHHQQQHHQQQQYRQ